MTIEKDQIKSVGVLFAICAVIAVLMALVNSFTAPIIKENEAAAANKALLEVLPGGGTFEEVDLSAYTLPATVTAAYRESNGGYVIQLTTTGFSSGLVIMCGVDASGTVTGALSLASSETLGEEKTYGDTLIGLTGATIDGADTVSGATKTTGAFKAAVKDALNAAIILGGGSVDIRSAEEILMDSLNEALPEAEGAFTSLFLTVASDTVDALYQADNGAGYVAVCGETYVALDGNGKAAAGADAALAADAEAAAAAMAIPSEALDLNKYEGISTSITEAYVTADGVYDITIKAAGYGINGDEYTASGEYIYVRLAITAEGEILRCVTVSQGETDGIGSACAEPAFYTQFNGRTVADYEGIDAISGATYTTSGYLAAVGKALAAVDIMKGVE